jgi:predicted nucleic acid-binding protein
MTRFAVDTSVVVAAIQASHDFHQRAVIALEELLNGGGVMLVPAHVVVETYSVLTRAPAPLQMPQAIAAEAVRDFVALGEVVALPAEEYPSLVERCAASGLRGGRVYDALIGATAEAGRAEVILTFNSRDFLQVTDDLDVREPPIG